MTRYKNREILILLNSIGITNRTTKIILENFQDLNLLFQISLNDIRLSKIHPRQKNKLNKEINKSKLENLLDLLYKSNINVVTCLDKNYPKGLKSIYDKPYMLYKKGSIDKLDQMALSIVGSRNPTPYGRWVCQSLAKELSNYNITIVSGLASGIDRIAHKVSLDFNNSTIAILGNGLDITYPLCNKDLYKRIGEDGCILTEYPLGTKPYHYNFPKRNRIISALSLGTVVVEAKGKSGSLITAHQSLEQGKSVFAVPGNINSEYSVGTNKLIKDGAIPLLKIDDIFEEIVALKEKFESKKLNKLDYSSLSDLEKIVVDSLLEGPIHCDEICQKTKLDISTVLSILVILEMKNIIREVSSRVFALL